MKGIFSPRSHYNYIVAEWRRPFGWYKVRERTKYCFAPCAPNVCDCTESSVELERFSEEHYEYDILNCELHVDNIRKLIDIVKNEPHDVLRGLARARLEGNAIRIMEYLIDYGHQDR